MNQLQVIVGVVTCVTAAAFGTSAFDLAPGVSEPFAITEGESAWIDLVGIARTCGTGFQSVELYMSLTGPFQITGILVDQPGAGTGFVGNSVGAFMDFSWGDAAIAMCSTTTGCVPSGSIVAKFQITASGAPGQTGSFTTDGTQYWGVASSLANGYAAVQDTLQLVVTPEPTTTFLVLAGASVLRRRSCRAGDPRR